MVRKIAGALTLALMATRPAHAQLRVAGDAINLSQVTVYNSPPDVASWPITAAITGLQMQPTGSPTAGLSFQSSALSTWPDYTPPGWDGPLQYTVWAVVNVNGQWYTSGFIQMWRGRASTGAPILTDFARNWAYDSRWGPMAGHQPQAGEQMGFFLTAGNARGVLDVTSVRERTNVVMVSLPAGDVGSFTFPQFSDTARAVVPADFNKDGNPDLLSQSQQGIVTLALETPSGFSQVQSAYNNITSAWHIIDVGDFNSDGRWDIVWQYPTGAVVVWFNNASGPPTSAYLYSGETSWRVAAVADIDRDGNSDLIWQAPTGEVVVWFMQGTHFVRSQQISGVSTSWRVVGARDFNGDGQADLVWQDASGAVVVWMMNGATLTSSQYIFSGASVWKIVGIGDVDGDGQADLIWQGPAGQILAWEMNHTAARMYKFLVATASGWQISDTP